MAIRRISHRKDSRRIGASARLACKSSESMSAELGIRPHAIASDRVGRNALGGDWSGCFGAAERLSQSQADPMQADFAGERHGDH